MIQRSDTGRQRTSDIPVAPPGRRLHPRHGTHEPTTSTPPRRPGSIRRTTSLDSLRVTDDLTGPVRVVARARDLFTEPDGRARTLGQAELVVEVGGRLDPAITSISSNPALSVLSGLLGRSAMAGFRASMRQLTADHLTPGDLLFNVLDDLPVALLVAGVVMQHAGVTGDFPAERLAPMVDLCAGWRRGGTILDGVATEGRVPVVTGPPAPVLEPVDDPESWHALDRLPIHGARRRRRIDVVRGEPGLPWLVDAMFRDTHVDGTGIEAVVHEYVVESFVDPVTATFLSGAATPRVLPWVECPDAAASASRLAGRAAADLREIVLAEFTGISTCTHLNDLMRSLADVDRLVDLLRA